MTSAVLRFPEDRLATFTSSFGAGDTSEYEVVGTKGVLRVKHAYEYAESATMEVTAQERTEKRKYRSHDQFAAELIYFSDCILNDRNLEPSGTEGLIDVHIIRSLYESAEKGVPVKLRPLSRARRPTARQQITRPAVQQPEPVHVEAPHRS